MSKELELIPELIGLLFAFLGLLWLGSECVLGLGQAVYQGVRDWLKGSQ